MQVAQQANSTRNLIIFSGKGGVGKTTLAENIAWWLAATGRIVGLVDRDSHPTASNFIDLLAIPPGEPRYTLSDVIQHNKPLLDAMYQVRQGLFVVPSDTNIEAASSYIVANEAQEIMIDRYQDMIAALSPPPRDFPSWHQKPSIAPRYFPMLPAVNGKEMRERPPYLEYLVWDFGAEPGPLGRAILRLPNCEIWAPVVLEPLPILAFEQMKEQIKQLFRNYPERTPPIKGVVLYDLTHKRPETAQEFVKLYLAHQDVMTRPVHEDGQVPPTQNIYPAQAIYEVKRTSRAAREIFEIALRIDGYTGQFEKSPVCKHCDEIYTWLEQQQVATIGV